MSELRARPKMLAWAQESNSHGLVLHDIIFLPEGDVPEVGGLYVRVPSLDCPAGEFEAVSTANYPGLKLDGRKRSPSM